eukprot:8484501-Ditylum_brightwellii.AAC.1
MLPTYGIISLEKDIALLRLRSLLKINYLSSLSAALRFGAVQAMSFILACKMVRSFPNGISWFLIRSFHSSGSHLQPSDRGYHTSVPCNP